MQYYRLSEANVQWLIQQPETAMGLQVVHRSRSGEEPFELTYVAGGQIVYHFGGQPDDQDHGLLGQIWMSEGDQQERERQFTEWYGTLELFPGNFEGGQVIQTRFAIWPFGPFSEPPASPSSIYGHLPYVGVCKGDEVFYRWEPFPTSRRIDQCKQTVAPGTFTAPSSEAPFVNSGFGAVGRYALPSLSPANWRWELRPPASTLFRCGASVPLYGQSGGGVEAKFLNGFDNVGPIANPIVLPSL